MNNIRVFELKFSDFHIDFELLKNSNINTNTRNKVLVKTIEKKTQIDGNTKKIFNNSISTTPSIKTNSSRFVDKDANKKAIQQRQLNRLIVNKILLTPSNLAVPVKHLDKVSCKYCAKEFIKKSNKKCLEKH